MKETPADQLRIVQRNELAYAAYSMTAQEKRLLWLAMGKLTRDTVRFPTWEIPVTAVAEYLEIPKENIYRDIKRIAVSLAGRVALIPEGDPCEGEQGYVTANFARVRYIPAARHQSGTAHIELHLREEIAPYLLELRGRFSSIEFTAVGNLSSFYAMRVYEILHTKRHETGQPKNLVTVSVAELRKMLELEKQYPNFKDFRLRVLEPAEGQINERTPMGMSFKELRARTRGAPVLAIEFLMWDKEMHHYAAHAVPAQMLIDWQDKTFDERLSEIAALFESQVDPKVIRGIAGKYIATNREEVVLENLRYAWNQIAVNPTKVKSVVRYCVAAIKRNYAGV